MKTPATVLFLFVFSIPSLSNASQVMGVAQDSYNPWNLASDAFYQNLQNAADADAKAKCGGNAEKVSDYSTVEAFRAARIVVTVSALYYCE